VACCCCCRRRYRSGVLSSAKQKLLESIGFQWPLKREVSWEDHLLELRAFVSQHGEPPRTADKRDLLLSKWIENCRMRARMGRFPPERVTEVRSSLLLLLLPRMLLRV
jgi:hypothetical protein